MRIAICAAQVPFVRGGAEAHVDGLRQALIDAGHDVEVIALPFKWYPRTEILKSTLAWRLIDITESNGSPVDLAICTKFPTGAVRHPNKIAWIIHQYRQAYDWFGTDMSDLTNSAEDVALRREIQRIDQHGLRECRARFANSANTAGRLRRFSDLDATPLHVPTNLIGLGTKEYDDLLLCVGRLDRAKRVDLLLKSLALQRVPISAIVVGDGPERQALESLTRKLGLGDRVRFAGRVPDDELVSLYNRCRAVYYGPIDEDFGLVTLESFSASKPVVTVADSGGVLELARDGVNALVAPAPLPEVIAPLLDRLAVDMTLAKTLGQAGNRLAEQITWERAVATLLGSVD